MKISLYIGSVFAYEMALTAISPTRYTLFDMNYAFLILFIICLSGVYLLTYKIGDFIPQKRKSRALMFFSVIVFIINTWNLSLLGNSIFDTYEQIIEFDFRYGIMYQNIFIIESYISVMVEYTLIKLYIKTILSRIKYN